MYIKLKRKIAFILVIAMVFNITLPNFATENSEDNLLSNIIEQLPDRPEEIYSDEEVENTICSVEENIDTQDIVKNNESEVVESEEVNEEESESVSEDASEEESESVSEDASEEAIEPSAVDEENTDGEEIEETYEEEPEEDYVEELEEDVEVKEASESEVEEEVEVSTDSDIKEQEEEIEEDEGEEYEEEPEEEFEEDVEVNAASESEVEEEVEVSTESEIVNLDFEEEDEEIATSSVIEEEEEAEVEVSTESEIVNLDFEEEVATESEIEVSTESEIVNLDFIPEVATESEMKNIATDSEIIISTRSIIDIASESEISINILGAAVDAFDNIYYKLTDSDKIIHFRVGNASGYTKYNNTAIGMRPTSSNRRDITTIVFDEDMYPNQLHTNATDPDDNPGFFRGMTNVTTITGLEHIKWDGNANHLTNYSGLFYGLSKLTSVDIEDLDFSNCKNVSRMFEGCSSLTGTINMNKPSSGFNFTSKLIDARRMFYGCSGLSIIGLSLQDFSGVVETTRYGVTTGGMADIFTGCNNLDTVDMSSIDLSSLTSMQGMFQNLPKLRHVNISNAKIGKVTDMSYLFHNCPTLDNIAADNIDYSKVTTMKDMFSDSGSFRGFTSVGVLVEHTINADSCINMISMFSGCANIQKWPKIINTNNVTTMESMFQSCGGCETLDMSALVTPKVTNMKTMFYNSAFKNINMSGANTANVTDMTKIFNGCLNLVDLNISNFNPSKVTDFSYMFQNCGNLKNFVGGLSKFNTSSGRNFESMFDSCRALEVIDISAFGYGNTSGTTVPFKRMFYNCSNLKTIYAKDSFRICAIAGVNVAPDMFGNCANIVGGNGTTYDSSKIDKDYAEIDGRNKQKGYFTDGSYYTVTFDTKGGSSIAAQTIRYNDYVSRPTDAPTKEYYNFIDWYADSDCTTLYDFAMTKIRGNITVYAKWQGVPVTITFDADGGSWRNAGKKTITYEYNMENPPSLPIGDNAEDYTVGSGDVYKANYDFIGWYDGDDNKITKIDTSIYENYTLKAKYKGRTYYINYNMSNGKWISGGAHVPAAEPQPFIYDGDDITLPTSDDIERVGHEFLGWYVGDTKWTTVLSTTEDNVNLTAKWKAKTYDISFNLDGGAWTVQESTITKQWTYGGSNVSLPSSEKLKKEHYTFDCWYDEDTGRPFGSTDVSSTRVGELHLIAHWSLNKHKITYYPNNGETMAQTEWTYGDPDVILPTITREHYTFDGWYDDATNFSDSHRIAGDPQKISGIRDQDIAVYAKWSPVWYEITYQKKNPSDAWTYVDESKVSKGYYYDVSDVELPKEYNGTTEDTAGNIVWENHNFTGWYEVGTNTKYAVIKKDFGRSINLEARWDAATYTIDYTENDGVWKDWASVPKSWQYGDSDVELPDGDDIEKANYDFAGWYDKAGLDNDPTAIKYETISGTRNKNIKLFAKWTPKKYNINYHTTHGDFINGNLVTKYVIYGDDNVSLPPSTNMTSANYEFEAWYDNESCTGTPITEVSKYITDHYDVYAKWHGKTYNITYELDADCVWDPAYVKPTSWVYASDNVPLPTGDKISKPNYSFGTWYNKNTLEELTEVSSTTGENITLCVKWIPDTHNIHYDVMDGGDFIDSSIVNREWTYNTTGVVPLPDKNNMKKNYYEFDGWYEVGTNIKYTSISKSRNTDIHLYAKWKPNTYTITYNDDGATWWDPAYVKPTSWVYASANVTLPTKDYVKKEGYDFVGWYVGSTKYEIIESTMHENITLKAKWSGTVYNITYDEDGGNWSSGYTKTEQWTYKGANVNLPIDGNITKRNYTLVGWKNLLDGKVYKNTFPSSIIGSVTLKAIWEGKKYTVTYNLNSGIWKAGYEAPVSWIYASTSIILPTSVHISRANYTFAGWYDDANNKWEEIPSNTEGPILLTARWAGVSFDINYDTRGGHFISTDSVVKKWVYASDNITLPTTGIEKEHYTFDGWVNVETGQPITEVVSTRAKNIEVYAKWSPVEYDINYELGTGASFVSGVTINRKYTYSENAADTVSLPAQSAVKKENYDFDGWYDNSGYTGSSITEVSKHTGKTITVYAKWKAKAYNITYMLGGDSTDPASWVSGYTPPTSWTYASYSVTLPASSSVTRPHYDFVGWFDGSDNEYKIIDSLRNEPITLHAKWQGTKYDIIYETNGGDFVSGEYLKEYIYKSGDRALPDSDDIKYVNHNFVGWYDNSSFTGDKITKISNGKYGVVTLYASWSVIGYEIEYIVDDDCHWDTAYTKPTSWKSGDPDIVLPVQGNITREHYTLDGWYDSANNKIEKIESTRTGNITLYARWIGDIYDIVYDRNGGTFTKPSEVKYTYQYASTSIVVLPKSDNIKRDYYNFVGWIDDKNKVIREIDNKTGGEVHVTASWSGIKYEIRYNLDNGHFIDESSVIRTWNYNDESPVVIYVQGRDNVAKDNYDFVGWFDAAGVEWTSSSFTSDRHENLELTARWQGKTYDLDIPGFDITWVDDTYPYKKDGKIVFVYGSDSIPLPTTTQVHRDNYILEGWYDNEECDGEKITNIDSHSSSGTRIYPKWKGVTYYITYKDGGATWNPSYTKVESWEYNDGVLGATTSIPLPTLGDLSREHYIFGGWYEGNTKYKAISSDHVGSITLTAKWTGEDIDITIDMPAGEDWDWDWVDNTYPEKYKHNPIKVEYGSESVILPTEEQVHKPHYDFEGFYDEDGNRVEEIDPTDPNSKHITPRFKGHTYEVDFDIDGGYWVDESSIKKTWVYASESLVLPTGDDVKKEYYEFDGWYYEDPEHPGTYIGPITEIESTTGDNRHLVVRWKGATYTIYYDPKGGTLASTAVDSWIYASTSATLPVEPEIQRANYDFDGWYDTYTNERVYEVLSNRGEHLYVYAKWKGKTYTITYVIGKGHFKSTDSVATKWIYASQSAVLPKRAELVEDDRLYNFTGWYDNSDFRGNALSEIDSKRDGGADGGVVLYGKWEPVIIFSINYMMDEGKWAEGYIAPSVWRLGSPSVPLPASDNIIRKHYIFEGWYDGDGALWTVTDTGRMEDLTLYAKWTGETYNIELTFDPDCDIDDDYWTRHGYTNPISFVYGSDSIILPDETEVHKPYHKFKGWYDDEGNLYDHITEEDIENDTRLHAVWELDTRSITYTNHGGNFVSGAYKPTYWVYASENVTLPTGDDIKREHYKFAGWYDNEGYIGASLSEINAHRDTDITLHAKWDGETYTITYDKRGGSWIAGYTEPTSWIYNGAKVVLPTASSIERTNYTFDGWYDKDNDKKITEVLGTRGSAITVYAKWTPLTYKIEYDLASGSFIDDTIVNKSYKYDVATISLPTSTNMRRAHYHFAGWYDNKDYTGVVYTEVAKGAFGAKKFYAKWDGETYTITYDKRGGSWVSGYTEPTQWIYASTSVILPASDSIVREHYTFVGWYDYESGNKFTLIDKNRDKSISLYASWKAKEYTIEYDLKGGRFITTSSAISKYTYKEPTNAGGDDVLPDGGNTIRDHYIFDGWYEHEDYSGGEVKSIAKGTSGSLKFYAKWKGVTYNIHYDKKDGRFVDGYVEPKTWIYASTSVILPASDSIVREHYAFDGWYDEESNLLYKVVDKNYNKDIYLYAKWTPLTYKIEYDLASGSFIDESIVNKTYIYSESATDTVNLPAKSNMKRDNYEFDGWYDNASYTGSVKSTVKKNTGDNVKYYAKWKANSYTIEYDLNDDADDKASWTIDESTVPKSWTYASASVSLPATTSIIRPHYRFVGWKDKNDIEYKTISSLRNTSIKLYASWEPLKYNITYEKNGGTFEKESSVAYSFTYKKGSVLLPDENNIKKANYTFVGWYATSSFIGSSIKEVSDGTGEDVKYYARWKANTYNITYDFNDDAKDRATWKSGYTAPLTWIYASTSVILPASDSIVREHYIFDGWYDGDKKITILDSKTSGSITLTAKWIGITYHVTFNNIGGHFISTESITDTWIYNTKNLELPDDTKIVREHFIFAGWYDAESGGKEYTMISEMRGDPIDLYARWTGVTYSVEYNRDNGAWINPSSVPYEWIYMHLQALYFLHQIV